MLLRLCFFACALLNVAQITAVFAADLKDNPFAAESVLPYQYPPFDKIKDEQFVPAIETGMREQLKEIEPIANNSEKPTFDNTIVALERSGQLLERANLAFSAVNGANTNDTLQATDTKTAPLFAAHGDFIYLNAKLFQRVKYLHDHQAELNLNPEQAKVLDVYYKGFVHAGAELPAAKQAQLKIINKRLSTLQTDFTQKLLAAAKAGAVHDWPGSPIRSKLQLPSITEPTSPAVEERGLV